MFSHEAVIVRVCPSPAFAALLLLVHGAAALAVALAGAPPWAAIPVGAGLLAAGIRAAWSRGLQRGRGGVARIEVRSDGRLHLWMRDGRELDARRGPDTWIAAGFLMLDLRDAGVGAPRGLLLTRRDAAGLRRASVLLRWAPPPPDEAAKVLERPRRTT